MIKIRSIVVWQVALTAVMILILSGQAHAVLTDFYNGATGDADPVSQGWSLALFDLTGQAFSTPDPDNDRVQMVKARDTGLNKYQLAMPVSQSIRDATGDDIYTWEIEAQVKAPEDADADGEPRHELSDFSFISGTDTGSAGFRDRFFFETTDRGTVERIRFTSVWFPTGNYSQTIRPHTAGNPQPWTNFTSVYDRNVYRFERNGLGPDTVKFFINGDLVFQGAGGISPIRNTQVEWINNTDAMNIYYHRFSFDVDSGTGGMPCDFNADSSCDVVDIDLLADAVRNGTNDLQFNVDGLGDPNIPDDADFDFYITDDSMLGTGLGDHDLNMIVNFNDFVVLSNNFGATPTGWAQGNGNTDDTTNFNDFVRLSNNFGLSFASGTSVPEPTVGAMLAITALILARRRCGRRWLNST